MSPIFKKGKRFEAVNYLPVLFSLPVNYLKDLRDFGLDKGGVDPFSPKYKLSSIICDVASFRLFKPVRSGRLLQLGYRRSTSLVEYVAIQLLRLNRRACLMLL